MVTILIVGGVIAGLIQYFVDYKGLKLYEDKEVAAVMGNSQSSNWQLIWEWLKNHWQFVGYMTIGIAGAFLTPLINEMVNGNLSGLEPFKDYAQCIAKRVKDSPKCVEPDIWYRLILLGYGIVFGYSGVRIIRSIGSLINGSIILKQKQQQDKIDELEKKLAELKPKMPDTPVTAMVGFSTTPNNGNPLMSSDYFNKDQNEEEKRGYYSDIDWANKAALFENLNGLLEDTHKTKLTYRPSLHVYPYVDRYKDGLLRSVYSGKYFSLETILSMDAEIDKLRQEELAKLENYSLSSKDLESAVENLEDKLPYNCEHVVPQSWFKKKEPMRGDLHHLFTCESKCNSFRSNLPYFDFDDYGTNLLKVIRNECGKQEESKFEPEFNKGVVARAVLYFLIRYPGKVKRGTGYTIADIPMLLKWHQDNRVELYELHRNQIIYGKQGNRNPFIDFPELANEIDFRAAFGSSSSKENGDDGVNTPAIIDLANQLSESSKINSEQLPILQQSGENTLDDSSAAEEYDQLRLFASCKGNPNPQPWKKWRPAKSLKKLSAQIDKMAPDRTKKYDGMIGDAAHQNRKSDHNPWVWDEGHEQGVVTALDITHDPSGNCDCEILADSLQANKDKRIKYVIWNRRIMNSASINGASPWSWRTYNGSNPHDKHIHISVSCTQDDYDSNENWTIKLARPEKGQTDLT